MQKRNNYVEKDGIMVKKNDRITSKEVELWRKDMESRLKDIK